MTVWGWENTGLLTAEPAIVENVNKIVKSRNMRKMDVFMSLPENKVNINAKSRLEGPTGRLICEDIYRPEIVRRGGNQRLLP